MSTSNFRCTTHIVPGQHIRHYPHGTSDHEEAVIRLAVKQYTPRNNPNPQPGDLTIIASHAIGMIKEMYEPIWDGLLDLANRSGKFRIRGIWMVEAHNQGESGLLNEGLLGDEPSWYDTARDVLSIVNQFRHEMPQPIMGVGHSFSAAILAQVALIHPRLFTAIAMLDPALCSSASALRLFSVPMIALRREQWPNKQGAIDFYARHPIFKAMDPRALRAFFDHGLMPVSPGSDGVRLKTTAAQESASFAKLCGPAEGDLEDFTPFGTSFLDLDAAIVGQQAYYRPEITSIQPQLPFLQPSCLFLNPAGSSLSISRPEQRQARLETTGTAVGGSGGAAAGRVREVSVEGTHYFPLEHPDDVAEQLHAYMADELDFFKEKQTANETRRADQTPDEHASLSKEYIRWAKILLADSRAAMKKRREDAASAKQSSKL